MISDRPYSVYRCAACMRFENAALILETMSTFDTMLQQFGVIHETVRKAYAMF